MLPDVALLQIFDFYVDEDMDRRMAHAGPRVSKMAKRCFWVTTSPEPATSLQSQNTSEGDAGRLATVAYCHMGSMTTKCGTWITSLRHSSTTIAYVQLLLWRYSKFAIGKNLGSNAAAIPGTDTSDSFSLRR